MVPDSGNDPLTYRLSSDCSTSELIGYLLVPTSRIERLSEVLQTTAMTTSAKLAILFGVLYEDRTHTTAFTAQCADHYTNNTPKKTGRCTENRTLVYWLKASYFTTKLYTHIFGRGYKNRTCTNRVKVCCATTTPIPNKKQSPEFLKNDKHDGYKTKNPWIFIAGVLENKVSMSTLLYKTPSV